MGGWCKKSEILGGVPEEKGGGGGGGGGGGAALNYLSSNTSLCSNHWNWIIMKFWGVITTERSDIRKRSRSQRSKPNLAVSEP